MGSRKVWRAIMWLAALAFCARCSGLSHGDQARADTHLPDGPGLSAKYPGDRGIVTDPSVLFAEDFESGDIGSLSKRWQSVSNEGGRVLALSGDSPSGSTGKRALQMTATLGENTGGHLYTRLSRGVDTLYARFYVKFAPDAPYIHHFVHMG